MFSIIIRLVHGVFEATSSENPGDPEWPPHPTRLFSGLVAVAENPGDLAALEWLETLPPPYITAAETVSTSNRSNWVITNELAGKKSHMEFAGRSAAGRRIWTRVVPQHDEVTFTWDGDPAVHAGALRQMARRLPYLGRSTTPVVARFQEVDRSDVDPGKLWAPDQSGVTEFTIPVPGFRAALASAYDAGMQPWTVGRTWCRYRPPVDASVEAKAEVFPSAYEPLIVFGIENRTRPPQQSVVRYTTAFRKAVMAALKEMGLGLGPVELHGHAPEDGTVPRHRVMFLGLPFVGSQHADGHLLGFGVCLPKQMVPADRALLYRGLLEVTELFGPGLPRVVLSRHRRGPMALDPQRWSKSSRTWVSAIPVVLDRHVTSETQIEPLIRSACRNLDLPEPTAIGWSRDPMVAGAERFRPHQVVRRRGERARPAVFVRVSFPQPVAGTMVLGNMRNLGLGLMVPEPEVKA